MGLFDLSTNYLNFPILPHYWAILRRYGPVSYSVRIYLFWPKRWRTSRIFLNLVGERENVAMAKKWTPNHEKRLLHLVLDELSSGDSCETDIHSELDAAYRKASVSQKMRQLKKKLFMDDSSMIYFFLFFLIFSFSLPRRQRRGSKNSNVLSPRPFCEGHSKTINNPWGHWGRDSRE